MHFSNWRNPMFMCLGCPTSHRLSSPESADLTKVGSLIQSALARLQQLDPLGGDILWEEWVELFRRVLDETSIPIEEDRHQGVQVLDAMTARGMTVRALFLLGMNEKVFPRYVREDPFLRDRQRARTGIDVWVTRSMRN